MSAMRHLGANEANCSREFATVLCACEGGPSCLNLVTVEHDVRLIIIKVGMTMLVIRMEAVLVRTLDLYQNWLF